MNIHHCDSTFNASVLCNGDAVKPGDILFVESERVVGIATPKPYALTVRIGTFDSLPDGEDADPIRQQFAPSILAAQQLAQAMAIRLDPHYGIKADAVASANAHLHNVGVPTYSQLARAISLILEMHPYAGTEREGEEVAALRRLVDALPCIELDLQEPVAVRIPADASDNGACGHAV